MTCHYLRCAIISKRIDFVRTIMRQSASNGLFECWHKAVSTQTNPFECEMLNNNSNGSTKAFTCCTPGAPFAKPIRLTNFCYPCNVMICTKFHLSNPKHSNDIFYLGRYTTVAHSKSIRIAHIYI